MKKKRLFALALAGMMVFGSATPVYAADGTDVGFTKAAPNKAFTMTVPTGNPNVATDGTFSSIGELKVVSDDAFDTGSKVEVTVSRSTVMTNTDTTITSNNTITYDLYTGEAKVDGNKVANGAKIEFSASQIDDKTSVKMGVAISGSNYDALEPGDYKDTITFSAEAVAASSIATIADALENGAEISITFDESKNKQDDRAANRWTAIYKNESGSFTLQSLKMSVSDRDYASLYASNINLSIVGSTLSLVFYGNNYEFYTDTNEYADKTEVFEEHEIRGGLVSFVVNGTECIDGMTKR